MFLTDMIALYLSLQLITHYSISATNLDTQHIKYVTIMNKNFIHIKCMSFFLDVFEENSNQTCAQYLYIYINTSLTQTLNMIIKSEIKYDNST